MHPKRNRQFRRIWRRFPNRRNGYLYGYLETDELARFMHHELTWTGVSYRDAAIVANIREQTRTWRVPSMLLDDDVVPRTGFRIREEGGDLWEILSATLRTSEHFWHCICVKLEEGDNS